MSNLTDAEILKYIERTPELKRLLNVLFPVGWCVRQEHAHLLHGPRDISITFHANEQRVREEEREACAKLCEKWAQKLSHGAGYALKIGADAIRERDSYDEPTAPQLSTADAKAAPPPEGAGQGEAAEAVGLLRDVKKDLEDRAEDGVVELSSNVWQRLCDYLTKQEGKP